MKYKTNYFGDDLVDLEVRLIYEEFDDSLHSILGTLDNEDESISFLLYEDYRMGNNPFSDINYFPEDITFSFEKIFMGETNIQNLWEIRIPKKNIENVNEVYDDENFWHEYNIKLKNFTQITIKGKLGWFSEDGTMKTLNVHEVDDNISLTQRDVFNHVEIICNTSFSDYKMIYYKKEIERFEQYLELPEQSRQRESNLKKIEELKKILAKLE